MKFKSGFISTIASTVMAIASAEAAASVLIENGPPSVYRGDLGETGNQVSWATSFGQTFRTPDSTNTRLNAFSFWLQSSYAYGNLANPIYGRTYLKAYVAEWNGTGISGPILFESPVFDGIYPQRTRIPINTDITKDGINPDRISLDPNKQYVAFFSVAGLYDGFRDRVIIGGTTMNTDSYSNGDFVWDTSYDQFPSGNWDSMSIATYRSDLAFTMLFNEPEVPISYNNVPEPMPLALVGLGLVGMTVLRRKKT